LIGSEFYNRMNRATLAATDYLQTNRFSSSSPLWFSTPISPKFLSWQAPLDADYVVFFKVFGVYRTAAAIRNNVFVGIALGGMLGGVIARSLSSEEQVATAAVVDLRDGRMIWFKTKTFSDVRNIEDIGQTLQALVKDLFRGEVVSKVKHPGAPPTVSHSTRSD